MYIYIYGIIFTSSSSSNYYYLFNKYYELWIMTATNGKYTITIYYY